ncbi:MAG: excinuclease ABC subunit C [Ignavibacteriales bacterium]|nr:excinuclease ABC subunit C [Ignavibacteriales bacterium]
MVESGSHPHASISVHDLSLTEKLNSLPQQPGVYQFKDKDGRIIYVGKAQSLRSRVRQYFQRSRASDARIDAMVAKIADVELTVTASEVEALILEANLIKQLKPRYNVVLKDDKSYPYIVITGEPFPRVFVTRQKKIRGGRYFGPYTDVKSMRHALKTVRDVFMIRSCNFELTDETIAKKKYKVCLDYHIKKCEGPCEEFVSRTHYASMIDYVAKVLRGKTSVVVQTLTEHMEALANSTRFEEAALVRDRIRTLSVYTEKQRMVERAPVDKDIVAVVAKSDDACGVIFKVREGKVVGSQHFYLGNAEGKTEREILELLLERFYLDNDDIPDTLLLSTDIESHSTVEEWLKGKRGYPVQIETPTVGDAAKLVSMAKANAQFWLDELEIQRAKRGEIVPRVLQSLQRDLRLPVPPRRIECFDISNTQGSDTVASLVVFADAKPVKSEYRKFKIRSVAGPNDFASMQEVISRRYSRLLDEEKELPDLIVVDGGKGQLSSAIEVLRKLGLRNQPTIGLAKRLEEVFLPDDPEPVLIPRTSSALRLLQHIRDEAHRFAVAYHRSVRSKRVLQTELDLIKGIGKARAMELLEAFGSVQGVKFATEEQLADVVGPKVAAKISDYFRVDAE